MNRLVRNIKVRWYRRKARKNKAQISFNEQMPAARSILVCLPEEKIYFDAMIADMDRLQNIFPLAHIILVYHGNNIIPAAYDKRFTLVEWNEQCLNRFGLLRPDFIHKLFASPIDIVIDLSIELNFINLSIAQKSSAPIKICFTHPQREELYNFIFRPKPDQKPSLAIQSLLNYLSLGKIPQDSSDRI